MQSSSRQLLISFLPDIQTDITIEVEITQAWVCQGLNGGKTTGLAVQSAGVDLTQFRPQTGDGGLVAPDDVLAPDGEIVRDVLGGDDQVHLLTVLESDGDGDQDSSQRHQDGGVSTIQLEPHGELVFVVWRHHIVRALLPPPH